MGGGPQVYDQHQTNQAVPKLGTVSGAKPHPLQTKIADQRIMSYYLNVSPTQGHIDPLMRSEHFAVSV